LPHLASFPQASFPQASFPQASFPQASFPQASFPQASFPQALHPAALQQQVKAVGVVGVAEQVAVWEQEQRAEELLREALFSFQRKTFCHFYSQAFFSRFFLFHSFQSI
jgi:hypothetical protein